LRILKRGDDKSAPVATKSNDTFVEELEEFADACRGSGAPEVSGDFATRSLAVVRAGIQSAREGRRVEVEEILKND
jgi:predicted dehydrogenase